MNGAGPLQIAVAGRPMPGEVDSGDVAFVDRAHGTTIMAVIDGLGHGAEAAAAATCARDTLARDWSAPIPALLQRCSEAMANTRGAAMTITVVHEADAELEWLGVGNVDAVLVRGDVPRTVDTVFQAAGVVGYRLPALLQSYRVPIRPGEVLVMTTDGIAAEYLGTVAPAEAPDAAADRLLHHFARPQDDALVLVARYRGAGR